MALKKWTFSTSNADIAFEWYPFEFLYFTPYVNFNYTVNKEIQDQLEHSKVIYGGLVTGITF